MPLDITPAWSSCPSDCSLRYSCYIPQEEGGFTAYCQSDHCSINLWNSSLIDGGAHFIYRKTITSPDWQFGGTSQTRNKQTCALIRDFYGTDKMDADFKTYCASVGIQ